MKKLLFLSLFFIQVTSFSQDANQLLKRVVAKITSVKDYSVDASIKTDIPFIKILPVKAKIYFKQKDKFKIFHISLFVINLIWYLPRFNKLYIDILNPC